MRPLCHWQHGIAHCLQHQKHNGTTQKSFCSLVFAGDAGGLTQIEAAGRPRGRGDASARDSAEPCSLKGWGPGLSQLHHPQRCRSHSPSHRAYTIRPSWAHSKLPTGVSGSGSTGAGKLLQLHPENDTPSFSSFNWTSSRQTCNGWQCSWRCHRLRKQLPHQAVDCRNPLKRVQLRGP